MAEELDTGTCMVCGFETRLTPRRRMIEKHSGGGDQRCIGSGRPPASIRSSPLARLVDVTANLDAYIGRRAAEIAAPCIAEAEERAAAQVADAKGELVFEKQRSEDLIGELRRQLKALERSWRRGGADAVHRAATQMPRNHAEGCSVLASCGCPVGEIHRWLIDRASELGEEARSV